MRDKLTTEAHAPTGETYTAYMSEPNQGIVPDELDIAPAAPKLLPELQAILDYHESLENGEREPDEAEFENLVFALYRAAMEKGQDMVCAKLGI